MPVFRVPFGVAAHIPELWTLTAGVFALIRDDLAAGFVADCYSEFVPEDPDPREMVYEFASWSVNVS